MYCWYIDNAAVVKAFLDANKSEDKSKEQDKL
jgi:hypothetical protein